MDLFYLLPDNGLITFSAMGRVCAAFSSPDEAYRYSCRHPETFMRLPNGIQLQSRFATINGKRKFMDRVDREPS